MKIPPIVHAQAGLGHIKSMTEQVTMNMVGSAGHPKTRPSLLFCRAQLRSKEFRLLPGCEVPALVDLMEVDQVPIGAPRPCFRGSIDLLRKYRDGHGERDIAGLLRGCHKEATRAVLPVKPSGRGGGIRQPVQRDVVQEIVLRAGDAREAGVRQPASCGSYINSRRTLDSAKPIDAGTSSTFCSPLGGSTIRTARLTQQNS
jgi:hypothetical protein